MSIFKKNNRQAGMSYVELIVVLSIFSLLSSVVIYNYGDFQTKVDIKSLSSDIALKIIEAQKSSLAGLFPPFPQQSQVSYYWKPSYGVYFNSTTPASFIYFVDLNTPVNGYDIGSSEMLETINITKGNTINQLYVCTGTTSCSLQTKNDLTIVFSRPDSGAILYSGGFELTDISYVQISITSPKGFSSVINVYPSGRVQIDPPAPANNLNGGGDVCLSCGPGDGGNGGGMLVGCGNGIIEEQFGEQCDDGNTQDGDGCSALCSFEGIKEGFGG